MAQYRLKTPKVIEKAVVGTYRRIESGVVGAYRRIERRFVDTFLERTDLPEEPPESGA